MLLFLYSRLTPIIKLSLPSQTLSYRFNPTVLKGQCHEMDIFLKV
jgi:hypothetical protein